LSVSFAFHSKFNIHFSLSICCVVVFLRLCITVDNMASKGLRAICCQVTQKLKRVTNLRIPLKPLLAILCVTGWASCLFIMVQFPKSTMELAGYFVLVASRCKLLLRNKLRHYSFVLAFSLSAEFQFLSL